MTHIGQQLRDADPLIHEPGLSPEDMLKIRQAVVAAARQSGFRGRAWRPALMAAVAMLALAAVVGVNRRRSHEFTALTVREADGVLGTEPGRASAARRQLQFSTPGGTRVIWVFDSRFEP
jgi:hypothetical protein